MAKAALLPGRSAAVDDLLDGLDHPLRSEIEALRALMLRVDPRIGEGVKWRSASFHAGEWFATVHLRSTDVLKVVMHLGARTREVGPVGVPDPAGLLTWLAADRAMLTVPEVAPVQDALEALVRAWVTALA